MKKSQRSQKSSTGVVFLRGKKVILRPPDKGDIPLMAKWINDPEIRCFINNFLPATDGAGPPPEFQTQTLYN